MGLRLDDEYHELWLVTLEIRESGANTCESYMYDIDCCSADVIVFKHNPRFIKRGG